MSQKILGRSGTDKTGSAVVRGRRITSMGQILSRGLFPMSGDGQEILKKYFGWRWNEQVVVLIG